MSVSTEVDQIQRMLDAGHLARADEDGHQRELRSQCPADDTDAPVYRVSRSGQRVIEVVFRCPSCARDFPAPPERMHLV